MLLVDSLYAKSWRQMVSEPTKFREVASLKTYAFSIQKGGTGKTTISGNVAFLLAQKGKKVVLVDADPQGNVTDWYLKEQPKQELVDMFIAGVPVEDVMVRPIDGVDFFVIPTKKKSRNLINYSKLQLLDEPDVFRDLVGILSELRFDHVIFDLGPGMGMLEQSVVSAADEVITPLDMSYFSLEGVDTFTNHLRVINKVSRRKVLHRKIISNKLNRSIALHGVLSKAIGDLGYDVFNVPQDQDLADCVGKNLPVVLYRKNARSIPALNLIAEAML